MICLDLWLTLHNLIQALKSYHYTNGLFFSQKQPRFLLVHLPGLTWDKRPHNQHCTHPGYHPTLKWKQKETTVSPKNTMQPSIVLTMAAKTQSHILMLANPWRMEVRQSQPFRSPSLDWQSQWGASGVGSGSCARRGVGTLDQGRGQSSIPRDRR